MIESRKRIAAILLTAILLATAIVVPQGLNASAEESTSDVIIRVRDAAGIIDDATVTLTEVHTGSTINAIFDPSNSQYVAESVPSGYYTFTVAAPNHYAVKNMTGFRHLGISTTVVDPTVQMTAFGDMQYTYTVRVNNTGGSPISGATVQFYHRLQNQTISSNVTDINGTTHLNIFGGGPFDLVVYKYGLGAKYNMSVIEIPTVSSSATVNVTLSNSARVMGEVFTSGDGTVSDVVAYLYNIDTGVPWEKRVLKIINTWLISFDAYPGNWILVVDGSNVDPYVTQLAIAGDTVLSIPRLDDQNKSTENVALSFSDWNTLDITTSTVWRSDRAYPGLPYSDIGSLRAQVDLALGNGDGQISMIERADFVTLVQMHSADYVTTSGLINIDDGNEDNRTMYISSVPANSIFVSDFSGPVTSTTDITYSSDVSYTSYTTLPTDSDFYYADMVVPYDTLSMNRTFTIDLVTDYELVSNMTTTDKVNITGYTIVSIDPLYSDSGVSEALTLDFQASETPTAGAEIEAGDNVYAETFNGTLLSYTVRNGTNVTFSAESSVDPNGNPLTFIWNFSDGTPPVTTGNVTVIHNFTDGAELLVVNLTVEDVTGRVNWTDLNVSVDSRPPRPVIKVYNMTDDQLSGTTFNIDQYDSLKFSSNGSADDLVSSGDGLGLIQYFEWTFGDEGIVTVDGSDTENQTVTHQFVTAGTIEVVLNVTDVVGSWTNSTVTVIVTDKTAPTIFLGTLMNETGGTSLIERQAVVFNATGTTDNVDEIANLTFVWNFGDGAVLNGTGLEYANVTHNYTSYGQYKLILNVTDTNNNTATLSDRTVYVGAGPRPNLEPTEITFDPTQFEEGSAGQIIVNITNDGSAVATNITIEIWYYSGTVAQKLLGNITTIYDENGTVITSLGVGESAYGIFTWVPDARGNYTIRAIVNCTDQKQSNWESATVEVLEAGWKKVALYAGVLVIIVVIPVLLIVRRRIASGIGMRRPRMERDVREEKRRKRDKKDKKEKRESGE